MGRNSDNWAWFFPYVCRAQFSMSRMMGTCAPANADPLSRIAGYVRAKRMSDDVDLATRHVIILLQNRRMRKYIKGPVARDQ